MVSFFEVHVQLTELLWFSIF